MMVEPSKRRTALVLKFNKTKKCEKLITCVKVGVLSLINGLLLYALTAPT